MYAAVAYAVWEHLTDQSQDGAGTDERLLDALLGASTRLSADLAGLALRGWTDELLPDLASIRPPVPLRTFRELDSQSKIHDELAFLLTHVLDARPDVTAVVFPLYGAFSLGLAARAVLPSARPDRALPVHLIRLGFHDLAKVDYLGPDGTICFPLTGPPGHRERLSADISGARVLVVDDNVGYGTTLRACRALVRQLGGQATTRCTETAWHLYYRSGKHDVADAADLPSLRPNLYYRIQERLIAHLLSGDAVAYVRDPAHSVRATLYQQMSNAYELALGLGTWSSGQLWGMRAELEHASLNWSRRAAPPAPEARSVG
ncbi:phosphoribosyltransferase [Streptomyces massasporeus]|uniref:phosphoribosyltransferase n=1 Tax=Streptomyces massasporeus TaxID=67324 RepID=UPI0033C43428